MSNDKQKSPQNTEALPGGAVPMEDYYMPDPNNEKDHNTEPKRH